MYSPSLNYSSSPLPPSIFPPQAPSSSSSSNVNIRALAQANERVVTESSMVLHPGERESRTSYDRLQFLFLLYCQRNMQKGLLCCIVNVLLHLLSAYAQ